MKQLTNKQHLVHLLPNSHLVTSLPFVDDELDNVVPSSKVHYLIHAQQQSMGCNKEQYIKELLPPTLHYVDSEEFEQEVARVQAKLEQKKAKTQKKESTFPVLPKKIAVKDLPAISQEVRKGIVMHQNQQVKNLNLDIYKKYGPLVLKELMEVLEKEKSNLEGAISAEREAIEKLNRERKYEQTEVRQREYDIGERIKIMLNKRRKVD